MAGGEHAHPSTEAPPGGRMKAGDGRRGERGVRGSGVLATSGPKLRRDGAKGEGIE